MLEKSLVFSLPKAELHAHLNGSISSLTMLKLLALKKSKEGGNDDITSQYVLGDLQEQEKSLEKCFEVFKIIHALVDTHKALYIAAVDVIHEFAADNVAYLELRTTPRHLEGSLRDYIDTVIRAIDDCHQEGLPILVKLLVSVDRSQGLIMARQITGMAIALKCERPDILAGLDVSGYMLNSDITEFLPLLNEVRKAGIKLTVHAAEVPNDTETLSIINFKPDRIGHGTYAITGADSSIFLALKDSKIPIELCLTSNVRCQTVKSYKDHHLKELREHGMPFCICTDDKGVFSTCLSEEYWIACQTFEFSLLEIWNISKRTLDYAFLSDDEKVHLVEKWDEWRKLNCF